MTSANETALQQHPLSAAFPAMAQQEIEALALDIETHGQREPGVLFDGMVLDGWHRYLACQIAGRKFTCGDFGGDDPVSYVLSKNLHRRHLSASQRAAAVVAAHNWRPHGDQSRSVPGTDRTTKEMAKEAEVSPSTIEHAKAAHEAGLGAATRDGTVSAKRAAEIAKLPEAKREQALTAPKPPKGKKPDVEKLYAQLSALETRLAETRESLAEMTDLAAAAKAFEEKTDFKEMQVLRVELRQAKRRRDELMAENGELKKEVARWRKRAGAK